MDPSGEARSPLQAQTSRSSVLHDTSPSALQSPDRLNSSKSYKERRLEYEEEKKKMGRSFYENVTDDKLIRSGVLKMRGSLRSWHKYWCLLYPGLLLYYKEDKRDNWVGTVILQGGQVMPRPSKKEGYSFRFSHPLKQPIHASRGPKGEIWFNMNLVPSDHCILRAPNDEDGAQWMEAIDAAIHVDFDRKGKPLSRKTPHNESEFQRVRTHSTGSALSATNRSGDSGSEYEEVYDAEDGGAAFFEEEEGIDADDLDTKETLIPASRDISIFEEPRLPPGAKVQESNYVEITDEDEEEDLSFAAQVLRLPKDKLDLLWATLRKLRPGVSLSTVVLPSFCHESRSYLDKLSDFFIHANLLSDAAKHMSSKSRMLSVIRWFLSGFYRKMKNIRLWHTPMRGELYRAVFDHPIHGKSPSSRVFLVAEQVEDFVSAFFVSGRRQGWVAEGSITMNPTFYGNTIRLNIGGHIKVSLVYFPEEEYVITLPDTVVSGISLGNLLTEVVGSCKITCSKTRYTTHLEFLPRANTTSVNSLTGHVTFDNSQQVLTIGGEWDGSVTVCDKNVTEEVLYENNKYFHASGLQKRIIHEDDVMPFEMSKTLFDGASLWGKCDQAIENNDLVAADIALREVNTLRTSHKYDEAASLFNKSDHHWTYKHFNINKWDFETEVYEYEQAGVIKCLTINDLPDKALPKGFSPAEIALAVRRSKSKRVDPTHSGFHTPVQSASHLAVDQTPMATPHRVAAPSTPVPLLTVPSSEHPARSAAQTPMPANTPRGPSVTSAAGSVSESEVWRRIGALEAVHEQYKDELKRMEARLDASRRDQTMQLIAFAVALFAVQVFLLLR